LGGPTHDRRLACQNRGSNQKCSEHETTHALPSDGCSTPNGSVSERTVCKQLE
jgi:hypothetical protein